MSNGLEHKQTVLVLGVGDAAGGGAIAKQFAWEGTIALVVRPSVDKLQMLVEVIHAGGKAMTFRKDARNEEVIAWEMSTAQKDTFGCIGANAGVAQLDTLTKNFASYSKVRRGPIKAVLS